MDARAALPVLFFIHGGAEVIGSANQAVGLGNLYDGSSLARNQQVVVVSTNYRLGALGFLSHPSLDAETPGGASGNYGLQDVITALEWTQANIARFGGDPKRVMIFGESAGALNTCALVASPLARGRFASAVMESGACDAAPVATRQKQGEAFSDRVGCKGSGAQVLKCLRSKPTDSVTVDALAFVSAVLPTEFNGVSSWYLDWGPTVDGALLRDTPLETIRKRQHNKVPMIIGSNADETELFLPAIYNTCWDYAVDVALRFDSANTSKIFAQYPCFSYLFPRWATVAWSTDAQFTCHARRAARVVAANQSQPVFRYLYTHVPSGPSGLLRAAHTAELPFVFDTVAWPTSGERKLISTLGQYWASLAATKTPNSGAALRWPRYTAAKEQVMILDEEPSTQSTSSDHTCDFWDELAAHE